MDLTGFWVLMLELIGLSSAYAIGRIHQWGRNSTERDDAYRAGYASGHETAVRTMPKVVAQLHQVLPGPSTGRHGGSQERLTTTDVMRRWRPDPTSIEAPR